MGAIALSAGLLIGSSGGAIALADSESGGSSAEGGDGAGQGAADGAAEGQSNSPHETGPGETSLNGVTGPSDTGSSSLTDGPTIGTLSSELNSNEPDSLPADIDSLMENGPPPSDPIVVPDPIAPPPQSTMVDSHVPVTDPTPPVTTYSAPVIEPPPPAVQAVEPVRLAFARMAMSIRALPYVLATLPTSPTGVSDVIASLQEMLASVAGAGAALSQAQNDLYALFGIPNAAPSLIGAGGALDAARYTAAVDAPLFGRLASPEPQAPPAGLWATPLFGTMTPATTRGVELAALNSELALSAMAPLAPAAVSPSAPRSLLEHVVNAMLVPASLTALAALALPGIAGLLVVCAGGMRIGYRQAKAVFTMRSSGIARFAGPGPLGVVRSGSLITLRQRARGPRYSRSVCPEVSKKVRTLERVA